MSHELVHHLAQLYNISYLYNVNVYIRCNLMPLKMEKIGHKIKTTRKELGLTQSQLAGFAGVSLRSLKEIESGRSNPTIEQLSKILDIMGLKIELTTIN